MPTSWASCPSSSGLHTQHTPSKAGLPTSVRSGKPLTHSLIYSTNIYCCVSSHMLGAGGSLPSRAQALRQNTHRGPLGPQESEPAEPSRGPAWRDLGGGRGPHRRQEAHHLSPVGSAGQRSHTISWGQAEGLGRLPCPWIMHTHSGLLVLGAGVDSKSQTLGLGFSSPCHSRAAASLLSAQGLGLGSQSHEQRPLSNSAFL